MSISRGRISTDESAKGRNFDELYRIRKPAESENDDVAVESKSSSLRRKEVDQQGYARHKLCITDGIKSNVASIKIRPLNWIAAMRRHRQKSDSLRYSLSERGGIIVRYFRCLSHYPDAKNNYSCSSSSFWTRDSRSRVGVERHLKRKRHRPVPT